VCDSTTEINTPGRISNATPGDLFDSRACYDLGKAFECSTCISVLPVLFSFFLWAGHIARIAQMRHIAINVLHVAWSVCLCAGHTDVVFKNS